MTISLSNFFSVSTVNATSGLPLWLTGKGVLEWVRLTGTALDAQNWPAAQAAGLTDTNNVDIGFGAPGRGITAYSGACMKKQGSEFLIFGGGGAHGWAGNDVRSLRLENNTLGWTTPVPPTDFNQVWALGAPGHAYMKDGASRNARHSYWQAHFINQLQYYMIFGCVNVWELDSPTIIPSNNVVDLIDWTTKIQAAPGTVPQIPHTRGYDGPWTVRHPVTELIYNSSQSNIDEYNPFTNAWTNRFTTANVDIDRGVAAIDPVRNLLVKVGQHNGVQSQVSVWDMSTWQVTFGTITGPQAANFIVDFYWGNGFDYCPDLGCFVMYQDDGFVYTLTRGATNATWVADRLTMTGTGPVAGIAGVTGNSVPIYGRFRYVENLKGVIVMPSGQVDAYFFRTA